MDFETTGVDVENDRIVTATVIVIEPGEAPAKHSWLIDPGCEIPEGASDIHGVTTEQAREHGRPPAECLAEIGALLAQHWTPSTPLVAYNLSYDLTLFDRECDRHGLPGVELDGRPAVDPLVIDRAVDRYRKGGRKLTQVCAHYGVELGEDAHTSDADTLATLRLAYKLAARYPREVGTVSLDALHATQIRWASAWCTRMRDYLLGQAVKLERAWALGRSGNVRGLAYVREQFERLEIEGEPSDDSVAVAVGQTRARALDFGSSGQWPMRPRMSIPHPANAGQTL